MPTTDDPDALYDLARNPPHPDDDRAFLQQQLVLAPAEPQPDAPVDIAKLPDYWDARRRQQGKPDLSRCAAELRLALAARANAPVPSAAELAALEHVFNLAEGHSGGSLRARRLLGAWWNGDELGGFDFADLWSLDPEAVTVVAMICRLPAGTYAHDLPGSFGPRMRKLHERMRSAGEARPRPDEP